MSHTPGPWQMHDSEYCPEEIWGNVEGPLEDGRIKATHVCIVTTKSSKQISDEEFANARLIAVSPDLLALANRVASLNPDVGEIGPGMLAQLVGDARRIVAKAKGTT